MGARVELRASSAAGKLVSGTDGTSFVAYDFELVECGGLADSTLHTFSMRYRDASRLHTVLSKAGGAFDRLEMHHPQFPPACARHLASKYAAPLTTKVGGCTADHYRNMRSEENRRIRAQELLHYWTQILLHVPDLWNEPELCAAIEVQSATASLMWVVVWQSLQPVATGLSEEESPSSADSLRLHIPPAHFRGWWLHDSRSESWDPMLRAMKLGFALRAIGRNINPDIEVWLLPACLAQSTYNSWVGGMLARCCYGRSMYCARLSACAHGQLYFTRTHFNVFGATFLGSNTDSFPLSGEEEIVMKDIPGQQPGKFSYKYSCDGATIRTWTWQWDDSGERRRWLTTSERRMEGDAESSFHEHVTFRRLDEPEKPDVKVERFMQRDCSGQRPLHAFPFARQALHDKQHLASPHAGAELQETPIVTTLPPPPTVQTLPRTVAPPMAPYGHGARGGVWEETCDQCGQLFAKRVVVQLLVAVFVVLVAFLVAELYQLRNS
jgi:hypothetical protein